jgi:Ca-activated chloride channel homolog
MKTHLPPVALLAFIVSILSWSPSSAVFLEDDRTLAPYFFIPGGDESVDKLPLKSTEVDVKVSGVIANVRIVQEYQNLGNSVIEARYTFPLSTRAAVHGMKMIIGERMLNAKVKEKEKARRIYLAAKSEGKTASLLEQHRPNVFTMSVANILPGDIVRVELLFTELLVPEDNVYAFVFPTVAGPRYSENLASSKDPEKTWVENPYIQEETPEESVFVFSMSIDAGMPIQELVSRTHKMETQFVGENQCNLRLAANDSKSANRDLIVEYRLAGDKIQTGLLMHEVEKENFFVFMAQPPARITSEIIPPRDYVFVIDVSGSMHGFPLDTSKEIMKHLFGTLRSEDTFNVVLFAGGSRLLSGASMPATPQNIKAAWQLLEDQSGGGGTRLLPAMKTALSLPKEENVSRSLVVLTDGYVDVELETFELIRNGLGDANLFAFGIGSSVNRFIVEGMARVGMGESFVVTDVHEASGNARKFAEYIASPILTNIEVSFQGTTTYDVEPRSFPDLFAKRPILVYGKWRGKPSGEVVITGVNGEGAFKDTIPVSDTIGERDQPSLKYLWARKRIAQMSDYDTLDQNSEYKLEVTNLGLAYNLATRFTSFVAVDETPRNLTGKLTQVKQPALQPKGVSSMAFSPHIPSTPEPSTYLLGASVALVLAYIYLRRRKAPKISS